MLWSTELSLTQSTEWHDHEITELVFCRSGSGHLLVGRHGIELACRRMMVIAPGVGHRFFLREGETAELFIVCVTQMDAVVHLSATQAAVLGQAKTNGVLWFDYPEREEWLWALVQRIPETLGSDACDDPAMAWSLIGLLVAAAAQRSNALRTGQSDKHAEKMREICTWIDANLKQSEKLDAIASMFGMSRSLLTREFRRHTGMSIVRYVNERRLQRAGNALMTPGKSILEVSLEHGYASLANFYKQFKAIYGVTPAEFRNQIAAASLSE